MFWEETFVPPKSRFQFNWQDEMGRRSFQKVFGSLTNTKACDVRKVHSALCEDMCGRRELAGVKSVAMCAKKFLTKEAWLCCMRAQRFTNVFRMMSQFLFRRHRLLMQVGKQACCAKTIWKGLIGKPTNQRDKSSSGFDDASTRNDFRQNYWEVFPLPPLPFRILAII